MSGDWPHRPWLSAVLIPDSYQDCVISALNCCWAYPDEGRDKDRKLMVYSEASIAEGALFGRSFLIVISFLILIFLLQ